MTTCNIIGCPCEGTNDERATSRFRSPNPHHPMKAHECGFTYFAASYGPRYGDPLGTYVSLVAGLAEDAAEKAAAWEEEELPGYCTSGEENCDCCLCEPDICVYGESTYPAKDLFSARELMENRRELLRGEVVCLSR